jgi:hypothetical protein
MKPKFALVTSWDDGHPLDLKIADLLSKYGLPGTFYIPARSDRSLLTTAEIQQLSERYEVGAHGIDGCELTSVSDKTARHEIVDSKKWVEDTTGKPCSTFCFPKGRFRRRHLQIARTAEFVGVRTVALMSLGWPARDCDLDVISTTMQVHPHSRIAYFRNFAKRLNFKNACTYLEHSKSGGWVPTTVSLLAHAAQTGGVFHLWGHSWEIEETNQWKELDEVFACMASYRKNAICLTNAELCDHGR